MNIFNVCIIALPTSDRSYKNMGDGSNNHDLVEHGLKYEFCRKWSRTIIPIQSAGSSIVSSVYPLFFILTLHDIAFCYPKCYFM